MSIADIAEFMDPVETPRSVRALTALHRWPAGGPPRQVSLRAIALRHETDATRRVRLLWYNTYLLPGAQIPVGVPGRTVRLEAKPEIAPRARELGAEIQGAYDVAALCEVFDGREQALVLDAWAGRPGPSVATGPGGTDPVLSSGLLTLSDGLRIVRTEKHMFQSRGLFRRDADAWSNKGVLLTELDLGLGRNRLELYSTHLMWGGGLPLVADPSPRAATRIRLQQVDEVCAFVEATHEPQNVAVVTGDFNISAVDGSPDFASDPGEPYRRLANRMRRLDMDDLWVGRNGTPGSTGTLKGAGDICPVLGGGLFCEDTGPAGTRGSRVDYIFVERQKPVHGFILDLTRPRRRPFKRRATNTASVRAVPFLSDHVGIDVTLIASPS